GDTPVLALDDRSGGVDERAQQARGVPQRARPGAALRERARRLALEIDDVGLAARYQHLAEMKVPVDARHQRTFASMSEATRDGEQHFAMAQPVGGARGVI